jgi:hypothetical protein
MGAVVAILLILSLAGCAALGAEPMIALIGTTVTVDRPAPTDQLAPAQGTAQQPAALPSTRNAVDVAAQPTPSPEPIAAPEATKRPRPTPKPTPRLRPKPAAGPFEINLYRPGDFVSQIQSVWCTAAAMQVMVNIMEPGRGDRTERTQARLYRLGQKNSTWRLDGAGIEPEGIERTLEQLGYGKWSIAISKTRYWAIRAAVRALRNTNRPVAMTTWRGAHTWVISGFKATADPAWTNKYEVTHLYIQDVWYPRVSSIWGASNPPNTLVSVDRLPEDYLPFRRPGVRYPGKDGNYLMIIPETRARR